VTDLNDKVKVHTLPSRYRMAINHEKLRKAEFIHKLGKVAWAASLLAAVFKG